MALEGSQSAMESAFDERGGTLHVTVLEVRGREFDARSPESPVRRRRAYSAANPYLTLALGAEVGETALHGPHFGGGVDGASLATEVLWNESFQLPVAADFTRSKVYQDEANLKLSAFRRQAGKAEPIGEALVKLKDVLHPPRGRSMEEYWKTPRWVPLTRKHRSRGADRYDDQPGVHAHDLSSGASSPSAARNAFLLDERSLARVETPKEVRDADEDLAVDLRRGGHLAFASLPLADLRAIAKELQCPTQGSRRFTARFHTCGPDSPARAGPCTECLAEERDLQDFKMQVTPTATDRCTEC